MTTDRTTKQRQVIRAVLQRYNEAASTGYRITQWPDEQERNARACDAYAEETSLVPMALEHTIIPTFDRQKQHDAQFMSAIGALEADLKNSFSYRLSLAVPMFAINKGQSWYDIRQAIKAWLLSNGESLPEGRSTVAIPGVPFHISLDRDGDPKSTPQFTVARWHDSQFDIPTHVAASIAVALRDKDEQLSRYKKAENHTILILESQDIALVNRVLLYRGFLTAYGQIRPQNIDQVWLAQTYEPEEEFLFIYCLLAKQEFMDLVNPPNAMFGPRYHDYWASAKLGFDDSR